MPTIINLHRLQVIYKYLQEKREKKLVKN